MCFSTWSRRWKLHGFHHGSPSKRGLQTAGSTSSAEWRPSWRFAWRDPGETFGCLRSEATEAPSSPPHRRSRRQDARCESEVRGGGRTRRAGTGCLVLQVLRGTPFFMVTRPKRRQPNEAQHFRIQTRPSLWGLQSPTSYC